MSELLNKKKPVRTTLNGKVVSSHLRYNNIEAFDPDGQLETIDCTDGPIYSNFPYGSNVF